MERLRQYEIAILMNKINKLAEDYNLDIATSIEIEAQADIKLHELLPELEDLAVVEAHQAEVNDEIKELKSKIKNKALEKKISTISSFNKFTYKQAVTKMVKEELGFVTIDQGEMKYQILSSDNGNLESIFNTLKEKFNL